MNSNASAITESILTSADGYSVGNHAGDAITANSIGILEMASDGTNAHFLQCDGYGVENINISGLTPNSNFGYARCILVPGTISSNYNVYTACRAANNTGSTSYNAVIGK
jgi:hypothetical protein